MKKENKTKAKKHSNGVIWGLFFDKLLLNADACVMVTDRQGKIVFINKKCQDLLKAPKSKLIDKDWVSGIVPSAKRKAVRSIFGEIKKNKGLCWFDTPVKIFDGSEKCLCWIATPLKKNKKLYLMFIGRETKKGLIKCEVKVHTPAAPRASSTYNEFIDTLFTAAGVTDSETAKHAARVMMYAVALAKRLDMDKDSIEKLKIASLLHDVGKLAVNQKILFKKGKLEKKEFNEIKKHPHWGSEIVKMIYFLRDIVPILISHHENYDGSGYPKGTKGKRIPLEARVLSVADIYEALRADRPYRKGFSRAKAIAIIEEEKGRKLDPEITDIFLDMVKKRNFSERWIKRYMS